MKDRVHMTVNHFALIMFSSVHRYEELKQTQQPTAPTCIETSVQCIHCRDGCSDGWTFDVDVALLRITVNVNMQYATKLTALANDIILQRCLPPAASSLPTSRHTRTDGNASQLLCKNQQLIMQIDVKML